MPFLSAADAAPAAEASSASAKEAAEQQLKTEAVAGKKYLDARREVHTPGFLEDLVDSTLAAFDVRISHNENTPTHYVVAACLLVIGLLLRKLVVGIVFGVLRRLASRTQTTLDDKLFTALEPPVGALVMLVGLFAALNVLKLPASADKLIAYASTIAFSLVFFWLLLRGFITVLDHAHEVAIAKHKGIAAFMPWIKKSLVTIFVIVGVLLVVQSLGVNVAGVLAGLGIGGLAFALAAQDTLANVFGSIVVAIDQPFKIGEAVKIGANEGSVEDIGLRSTKLRRPDKSLVILPNKLVAAEPIINNSRFTRRRVEQVLGLTYDTTAEQMDAVVGEIKDIVSKDPDVDPNSVMVYFRDFSASSLDVWVVYETPDPDFQKHMTAKQRLNFALMRAVYARGLSFAFPTQTLQIAGDGREKLTGTGTSGGTDQPSSVQATPPPKG
ncbi:MAG: mechanosensitive ion channel family protein [Verrucomicrobiota bacterium]